MHAALRRHRALKQLAGSSLLLLVSLAWPGCLRGCALAVVLDISDDDFEAEDHPRLYPAEPAGAAWEQPKSSRVEPASRPASRRQRLSTHKAFGSYSFEDVEPRSVPDESLQQENSSDILAHVQRVDGHHRLLNDTVASSKTTMLNWLASRHNLHNASGTLKGAGASKKEGESEYVSLLIALSPALVVSPAVALFVFYVIFGDDDLAKEIDERTTQLEDLGSTCDNLSDQVRSQIEDLVEKQVDWSQHDFNNKKEDFLAYLEFLQEHIDRLGGAEANEELGALHRQFCLLWLQMFKECSKNPVTDPYHPISQEELAKCPSTVTAASAWLAERLYDKDVQFVDLGQEAQADRRGSAFMVVAAPVAPVGSKRAALLQKAKLVADPSFLPAWINVCSMNKNYSYEIKAERTTPFPCELMLCLGTVRIHFVSPLHCSVVVYWCILLPICYYVYMIPHVVGAVLILLGWGMVSVLLIRFEKIDVVAQLTGAEAALRQEQDDVKKVKDELAAFYKNVDEVSRVWTSRTRPRLDIMKQIMRKVMETRWSNTKACKDFLEVVVEGLQTLEKSVGRMDYYCYLPTMLDRKLLGRSAMALMQKQLEKVAGLVRCKDTKELTRKLKDVMLIPNLLAVRILAGHAFPKGTWTDTYDPYVRLRAKKEGDWVRTHCIPNCNSPRWHTPLQKVEYRFLVEGYGKQLEFEVLDQNSVCEDTFMGAVSVAIDDLSTGSWNRLCEELQDPVDPSTPGQLEIEVFLAREAGELHFLMGDEGGEADEDEDDSGSENSSEESFA
eukprot:TRINITY_DN103074_c0_g1_i1.p1 TRINITY_DN103074_c0_g1~~TRINITY_DN103074_c0_g1_i1.p1  ORF type:complete len:824 (+),score=178.95 TRINITY_DN103074_c0_g1_i1:125-2473(+)